MTWLDWLGPLGIALGIAAVLWWLTGVVLREREEIRRCNLLDALLRSGSLERRSPRTLDLPSARVVRGRRKGRL